MGISSRSSVSLELASLHGLHLSPAWTESMLCPWCARMYNTFKYCKNRGMSWLRVSHCPSPPGRSASWRSSPLRLGSPLAVYHLHQYHLLSSSPRPLDLKNSNSRTCAESCRQRLPKPGGLPHSHRVSLRGQAPPVCSLK